MTGRRTPFAISAALATSALVAGALAVPSAEAAADAAPGSGSDPARGVRIAAERAAAEGIDWQDCPADWGLKAPVQCGRVTVPIDYRDPDGRTIDLAVSRVESTGGDAQRQGVLLNNPGGPGGSGLGFPRGALGTGPVWPKVATAYDLVGFDPRGVGRSAPVFCTDPEQAPTAPKLAPVPENEADKRAQREIGRAYSEGCAEHGGALMPHMNTPDTARDMDVIRAALGERKVSFFGTSYGTYLGAVYAELFPGHTRRFVFDSVSNPDPGQDWYEGNLEQNVSFEMRWSDYKKWLARHHEVYGIGATPEDVQTTYDELTAKLKKQPLDGVVGPSELQGFLSNALYSDGRWDSVADAWSAYLKGDTAPLADGAAPGTDPKSVRTSNNSGAVYLAVECNDSEWPESWRTWDRDNSRMHEKEAPFGTWPNAWYNLPCMTWPYKSIERVDVRPGKEMPPALIVQAERDGATPYAGAVELHRRLTGSRLITERDAGNHGVTGYVNNPCVDERVVAYFLDGTIDAEDVTCDPHPEPQPRD